MTRILVVEDEPGIAFGLETDLQMEGYEVTIEQNGAAAVERVQAGNFDMILLDVMLPGMDGFEVCRTLRRSGVRTPIILVTARTHEAEKVMGLEVGADDYVTKPFSLRELRARIKAVLRRTAGELPETYRLRGRGGGFRPWRIATEGAACGDDATGVQAPHGLH